MAISAQFTLLLLIKSSLPPHRMLLHNQVGEWGSQIFVSMLSVHPIKLEIKVLVFFDMWVSPSYLLLIFSPIKEEVFFLDGGGVTE